MTTTGAPAFDEAGLHAFVGQAVVDMGAAISGLMLHLGDRLGFPARRPAEDMAGHPVRCFGIFDLSGGPKFFIRTYDKRIL
ncbi:hypothetical protein [Actinocorallia longicatena]|uniref:Uncharacterized protein n=1 Tax=Actinocorallia longicatena TaxID=111803 RepID=A0ABP6Q991_9ACTN